MTGEITLRGLVIVTLRSAGLKEKTLAAASAPASLAAATWESLERKIGLGSKHGLTKDELLAQLAKQLMVDLPRPEQLLGIGKGGGGG
jgi:hypothetical protein